MLYYNRIDISEGIDANKTIAPKEFIICQYWHFLDKGFMLVMSIDINSITILNIHSANYRCIMNGIRKSRAIKLLTNADLSQSRRPLIKRFFCAMYKR